MNSLIEYVVLNLKKRKTVGRTNLKLPYGISLFSPFVSCVLLLYDLHHLHDPTVSSKHPSDISANFPHSHHMTILYMNTWLYVDIFIPRVFAIQSELSINLIGVFQGLVSFLWKRSKVLFKEVSKP